MFESIRLTTVLLLLLTACADNSVTVIPSATGAVRSASAQPKDLLRINSLFIARPTLEHSVDVQGDAQIDQIYQTLLDAAKAELSMDLQKHEGNLNKSAIQEARLTGADSVLLTNIQRYNERDGTSLSAEVGAAASFVMKIVRLSDDHVVWSSSYAFSDIAMNQNLLRVKDSIANKGGSAGWATASRIIGNGFRQGLKDFNDLRTTQFIAK